MSIRLRNFLITFGVALLLFSAVAFFVIRLVAGPSTQNTDDTGSNSNSASTDSDGNPVSSDTEGPGGSDTDPTTPDPVKAGESFTFMLVGTDYQPDVFDDYSDSDTDTSAGSAGLPEKGRRINADTIMIFRVNKDKRVFMFSALAPNTKTSTATGVYSTLNDSFRQGGAEGLMRHVGSLTGLTIDYYAVVGISDCVEILDLIDNISFNVPCDMKYTDESQGLVIDLKKGVQTLTSKQALNMLRFDSYPNSTNSRLSVSIDFMKTVLTKITQASYINRAGEFYVQITDKVETNFTSDDLISNLDLIASYKDYSKATVTYPVSSEIHNGWEYLAPDLKGALAKYSVYK